VRRCRRKRPPRWSRKRSAPSSWATWRGAIVKRHGNQAVGQIREFLVSSYGDHVERLQHLENDQQRQETATFLQTLMHTGGPS